jgi:hypothetical protein
MSWCKYEAQAFAGASLLRVDQNKLRHIARYNHCHQLGLYGAGWGKVMDVLTVLLETVMQNKFIESSCKMGIYSFTTQ